MNQISYLDSKEIKKEIKTWMSCNFLLLNSDKTDFILLGPKHLRDTLFNDLANLDGHYPGLQHHCKESGSYL